MNGWKHSLFKLLRAFIRMVMLVLGIPGMFFGIRILLYGVAVLRHSQDFTGGIIFSVSGFLITAAGVFFFVQAIRMRERPLKT